MHVIFSAFQFVVDSFNILNTGLLLNNANLGCAHFTENLSELTKTWSSGATECRAGIGNCNVKVWKSTEHKLHNISRSVKFQQNEHTPESDITISTLWKWNSSKETEIKRKEKRKHSLGSEGKQPNCRQLCLFVSQKVIAISKITVAHLKIARVNRNDWWR